jgi:hypothetical protein
LNFFEKKELEGLSSLYGVSPAAEMQILTDVRPIFRWRLWQIVWRLIVDGPITRFLIRSPNSVIRTPVREHFACRQLLSVMEPQRSGRNNWVALSFPMRCFAQ